MFDTKAFREDNRCTVAELSKAICDKPFHKLMASGKEGAMFCQLCGVKIKKIKS
jgi:hypothetical protein